MKLKITALLASLALFGGLHQASAAILTFDTATFPGTGIPLSVTGSDGDVFTFEAGSGSQFESFASGFVGSYPLGTYFLAAGLGNTTPITVSFSNIITSIEIPVSSDRVGNSPYSSTVNFYDGTKLVDSVTKAGNTLNPAEVFKYEGAITSAVISTLVDSSYAPFGYTQNLGPLTYSVSSVPLPASAPMFGAALLVLGGIGYGVKRKVTASA